MTVAYFILHIASEAFVEMHLTCNQEIAVRLCAEAYNIV